MNRGEQSVAIIKGKLTGDSRGFRFGLYSWRRALWLHECSGFVEMSNKDHEEFQPLLTLTRSYYKYNANAE
jgi:hypothetical protein